MKFDIGDKVESLINNSKIKVGEVGIVTKVDKWIGEEYPYVMVLPDGRDAAYAGFELRKVN